MNKGESGSLFDDGNVDGGGAGRFVHLRHPCQVHADSSVPYRLGEKKESLDTIDGEGLEGRRPSSTRRRALSSDLRLALARSPVDADMGRAAPVSPAQTRVCVATDSNPTRPRRNAAQSTTTTTTRAANRPTMTATTAQEEEPDPTSAKRRRLGNASRPRRTRERTRRARRTQRARERSAQTRTTRTTTTATTTTATLTEKARQARAKRANSPKRRVAPSLAIER